ncbi:MAG: DUF1102 domain-containing protein [Halodesulfurarchaeum sp.]
MVRPSRLAVALAIVGSVLLVVSTGAASWTPGGPTDELQEGLQLQPSSDYAYLSTDNETVIDISPSNEALRGEGLNPDAVVTFEDVATLRNGGDTNATVWVTTDAGDPIRVTADGQPIDGQAANVTLVPSETLGIDLVINTTNRTAVESVSTLTVHGEVEDSETAGSGGTFAVEEEPPDPIVRVRSPAADRRVMTVDFARPDRTFVGNLSELAIGSGFDLQRAGVAVADRGNLSASIQPAAVSAGAVRNESGLTPLAAVDVDHQAGPTVTDLELQASVPISALPQGTAIEETSVYRAADGGWEPVDTAVERSGETLRVTAAAGQPGRFVVVSAVPAIEVETATLLENESADPVVSAVIRNRGTGAGNDTVVATANGEPFANRTVTLGPDEPTRLNITAPAPTEENLTIALDGVVVGTVNRTPSGPNVTTVEGVEVPAATGESTPGSTITEPETEQPESLLEEPAGIPLSRIGGMGFAGGLFVALVALIRRVPV